MVVNVCPSTGLFIDGDDITLNCSNKTLTGDGGNSSTGIWLSYDLSKDGVEIRNCRITRFGFGIELRGFEVSGVVIRNNRFIDNGLAIFAGDNDGAIGETTIRGNWIKGGGMSLIDVVDFTIQNNRMDGGGIFITESSDNTIRGNLIKNGGGSGIDLVRPFGHLVHGNKINNNGGDGIHIRESHGNNKFVKNKLNDNGGDGIESVDSGGDVYRSNRASRNGGWGICVGPGNIDDGGNRGRNNLSGDINFAC